MKKRVGIVLGLWLGAGVGCCADGLQEGKTASSDATLTLSIACEHKDPQGCFELARRYEKGEGLAQNKYAAASLYAHACRLGYTQGCANMGMNTDTP